MKKIYIVFALALGSGLYGCFSCDDDFVDDRVTNISTLELIGNTLFALNGQDFVTIDVSQPDLLVENNRQELLFDATDVFGNDQFVFINSLAGLRPYDAASNSVEINSVIEDINLCPEENAIVVNNLLVAAHNGTSCFTREESGIYIYEIMAENRLVQQSFIELPDPQQVAVDANWLFATSMTRGLLVYDISLPTPELIHQFLGFDGTEINLNNNLLMVVGDRVLHQFTYDIAGNTVEFLSSLN